jgi:hypothetical protein
MGGPRQALIVATDHYKDPGLGRLRAPARDADTLARVLGDPAIGGFEVEIVTNQPEWRLRRTIGAFFADRSREDLLLLCLLCHGVTDSTGQLYFATTDTQLSSLDMTAVPADFVNRQMTRSQSRQIVLLLDCYYSGAFARGMMAKPGDRVGIGERLQGRGRVILAASDAMQYAFEGTEISGDAANSVFTRSLVSGLRTGRADLNHDGYVSLDELYDYVHEEVVQLTPQQRPAMWAFDVHGDLWIARSPHVATIPAPARRATPAPRLGGRRWPRVRLPWPRRRRQVTRPRPRPGIPEPSAESAGGYDLCPSCGHAVKADTRFCGVCGEYLRWDEPTRVASAPPVTPIPSPDERAVFTIAYPNAVSPTIWYSLHVYLHRSRLQAVVDKRIVDQFRGLGLRRSTSTAETLVPLLHGTVVHVKPRVNGLAFNPVVQGVEWWEDLHEVLFRFRALNTAAVPLLGSVDIYAGPLLIAQVPIAVSVGGIGQPEQSGLVEEGAEIFSRIFASYSHQDSDIVSACAEAYRALGIEMLIDRDNLRSGQDWRSALQQLIEDADTFQLFWSTASSVSLHVAEEWRHALQLRDRKGGQFIRPLCWENPWPTAPDELSNLHFALLDLRELSRVAGRSLGSADTSQP